MSDFKAQCGCTIHVTQWTSKRKIASVKYCETHKAKPLDAEIVELRKDRDRLDWLKRHVISMIKTPHGTLSIDFNGNHKAGETSGIAFIKDVDAAMAEGKGAE